jgi:hypothetical protein
LELGFRLKRLRVGDFYNYTKEEVTMNKVLSAAILVIGLGSFAHAAENDERGGTCEDARSQYRYFCKKEGYELDIMMNAPLACNNAKRNMAAACEGVSEEDYAYEFSDGAPKQ